MKERHDVSPSFLGLRCDVESERTVVPSKCECLLCQFQIRVYISFLVLPSSFLNQSVYVAGFVKAGLRATSTPEKHMFSGQLLNVTKIQIEH